jgi:hypothetical protein
VGRREAYQDEVVARLGSECRLGQIADWLTANSNLPGPRGNLELAWAFGDAFSEPDVGDAWWPHVSGWLAISEREAPTGDPREFLPFCALQAAGSYYAVADAGTRQQIVEALKRAAGDGRWRIREAVAMGFQRIAESEFETVVKILEAWIGRAPLLERRAIVATLAHSRLLTEDARVALALELVDVILCDVHALTKSERRTEGFRALKKGLAYSVSVLVAAGPDLGFPFVERWAAVDDVAIRSIMRTNLRKSRLAKRYPDRVAQALRLLERPAR